MMRRLPLSLQAKRFNRANSSALLIVSQPSMRRVLLLSALSLLALGAAEAPSPPTPLPPAEAAKQGRALAAEILSQTPAYNVTNTGVLKIRDAKRLWTELPLRFEVITNATNWSGVYEAEPATNGIGLVRLTIVHNDTQPAAYDLGRKAIPRTLSGNELMIPFAGSDFWVVDLGLEFFHWPEQRLLRNELRRSRSCRVLESVNPQPAPGAYSRVLSWIDAESDGPVHAEAYDFNNKLLKEFDPKEFKKVNGHWEWREVEIANRQTGTRARIELNLGSK